MASLDHLTIPGLLNLHADPWCIGKIAKPSSAYDQLAWFDLRRIAERNVLCISMSTLSSLRAWGRKHSSSRSCARRCDSRSSPVYSAADRQAHVNVYQESSGLFSRQKAVAMAFETSFGLESHCNSDCSCLMAKSSNAAVACSDLLLDICAYVMVSSRAFSCASLLLCSHIFC